MSDNTKEIRGNPKLAWVFGALIVAAAALSYVSETQQQPAKKVNKDPQSYLKNCALKTALERPRQ